MAANKITKQSIPLSPSRFAFGGGTKPISEVMFNKYDTDKNGSISRDELRSLCYDLGYYLSDDELTWAWTVMDKDGSGMIDYNEFAEWWKTSSRFEHLKMPNEKEAFLLSRVAEICRSYDTHNTGTLDRDQFTSVCQALTQEEILNANEHQACNFDEIDRGHDGRINFNELIAWFKNVGLFDMCQQ
ncbi:unnamed protein product [Adineta steineri]|uniref:EF-hand domain-containing protein n=1 Tax=Adineta steineri TaxID=433720 RepID=A0A814ZNV3_9BILA|nr:unnamed protein product [Adineta steineri]CAF4282378.1 unnamed protein product [Adineta steineri]